MSFHLGARASCPHLPGDVGIPPARMVTRGIQPSLTRRLNWALGFKPATDFNPQIVVMPKAPCGRDARAPRAVASATDELGVGFQTRNGFQSTDCGDAQRPMRAGHPRSQARRVSDGTETRGHGSLVAGCNRMFCRVAATEFSRGLQPTDHGRPPILSPSRQRRMNRALGFQNPQQISIHGMPKFHAGGTPALPGPSLSHG